NLLETGCLITRIRPLATNPSTALVKAPKLLWTDCGLAAWLAGIKSSADVTTRMDAGFWLEQTLFQTLETWRALDPQQRKLHFWRDRAGHEVDFILEEAGKLVALEIKAGSQVTTSDTTGIRAFRDDPKNSSCRLVGRMFGGVFGSYAERFWLRCSPAGSSIGLSLSTAPQLCLHGLEPLGYWRSTASGWSWPRASASGR